MMDSSPEKQAGIQVMIVSAIIHLLMAVMLLSITRTIVPPADKEQVV